MKKIAAFVLASVIGAGGIAGTTHVFADSSDIPKVEIQTKNQPEKVKLAKQFDVELHQSNKLKKDRLALNSALVTQKDKLIDLKQTAMKELDKDKKKKVKEIKKQLKDENKEISSLQKDLRLERKELKVAIKSGNKEKVQEHLNMVLKKQSTLNKELEKKKEMLAKVISIMNKA
ncbi:hypothetical protein [Fictibacillus fluitans]|uniref:Uncharacterized protein n=1 Tax=Fictibacillus fluitans TaxID=3058422 RepID=A0ABT8HRC9_9BACL|nr:hypothetical protein [Fictibacillus sp. NE201]MDN4523327.1 hypothetical protein [Fictibacillus sp. NE201]